MREISGDLDEVPVSAHRALLGFASLSCPACATAKTSRKRYVGRKDRTHSYSPYEMVSMDHCGPFPVMMYGLIHTLHGGYMSLFGLLCLDTDGFLVCGVHMSFP